ERELGDEAILLDLPRALDAALRLGRAGGDVADAELFEDVPEVRGVALPGQFFLDRPVAIVPYGDAGAIAVEAQGDALALDQVAQRRDVAVQVFLRPEARREDLARGVIDHADQAEHGLLRPQPVEGTA